MKSRLAIAVTLWGWLLFLAWLSYDYVEYGNQLVVHIFREPLSIEKAVFYVLILLVPFIYTFLGYLVNERVKLLQRLEEFERYRAFYLVDELTNLLNRRGFFTLAEQQLKMANRNQKGILLLYIDFDGLKQINDTFGHSGGDMALKDATSIIKGTFRQSDIVARIGGDEFVVLALETSWAFAETLSTRLQQSLRSHNAEAGRPYKLSFSVGYSYYDPGAPCSLEELIARADSDMYEQKLASRDEKLQKA